jgi:hypothetical protein
MSYLAAVVFYEALFNELPKSLPTMLKTQRNQQEMTKMITININQALSTQMLSAVNSIN